MCYNIVWLLPSAIVCYTGVFMKKLIAIIFAVFVIATNIFATDGKNVEFPTGTWVDENWNANWVMDVAKVHLYDAITGDKIFTFTKDNTKDFKFVPSADGVSLSFYCAETHRFYKFTKSFSLDKDLTMFIDPDWTDVDYNVNLKFKSVNMPE